MERKEILMIKGMITELNSDERDACLELAEFIRCNVKRAGPGVGAIALALVGLEAKDDAFWEKGNP